jgi:hypothetical protein
MTWTRMKMSLKPNRMTNYNQYVSHPIFEAWKNGLLFDMEAVVLYYRQVVLRM